MATANSTGIKAGPTVNYDPDGVTTTIPDNSPGAMDYGWLGAHQRPTEHAEWRKCSVREARTGTGGLWLSTTGTPTRGTPSR